MGWAFDHLLIYGTGGLAIADAKEFMGFSTPIPFGGSETATGSRTQTLWGWTIGGGIAYAFDSHWSVNTQVRYASFGKDSYPVTFSYAPPNQFTYKAGFDEVLWTTGLSYRFP